MAERRMFAKTIIDSDAFLDMPLSTQALYFHLSMRADDEGFVGNPKKIQKMIGASDDDCKILIAKRFILAFPSGIIVIKHWKINNLIQKDRFHETTYFEEKATLALDANKAYTEWIQLGSKMDPQVSIGKVSIDQERKKEEKKINTNKACACDRTCEEVSDYPFGTYDEIFDDLDVHGCYRLCVVEFIKHLQLNGVKVLNSRLESLIIALDKEYGQDDISKCKEIKNAIANGYKRLPCEETE